MDVRNTEAYSTLELDTAAIAPEISPRSGKQVAHTIEKELSLHNEKQLSPGQDKEIAYDFSHPEAVRGAPGDDGKDVQEDDLAGGVAKRRKRKRFYIIIGAILFTVAVAVGVGVGVGVGVKGAEQSSTSPGSSQYAMLDDTSFAVVSWGDADLRLFFQDVAGTIRQAEYSNTTGSWTADTSHIVATGAKLGTPITASNTNYSVTWSTSKNSTLATPEPSINLFFLDINNQIQFYQFASGTWLQQSPANLPTTANASRLAYSVNNFNGTYYNWMFSQAPNGTIQSFFAVDFPSGGPSGGSQWQVYPWNSTGLTPPDPGTDLSAYTVNILPSYNDINGALLIYVSEGAFVGGAAPTIELEGNSGQAELFSGAYKVRNSSNQADGSTALVRIPPGGMLPNSDFVETQLGPEGLSYLWYLNADSDLWQGNFNDVLNTSSTKVGLDNATFPYNRMALFSPAYIIDTDAWIYHQINGSFIAEEHFHFTTGFWTTSLIEISI